MKIDKIIFSTSELYSPFWNIQSRIWKESFGIEPVCILYGKKDNTDMTEDYGTVIERDFMEDLPEVLQITWSKFDYPKTEPETTWIMGDMDMIPLQTFYFMENIQSFSEDSYLHLNYAGIANPRREYDNAFLEEGSQTHAIDQGMRNRGADLPGHYHVSKGKNFIKVYELERSYREQVEYITSSHRYGMGPHNGYSRPETVEDSNMYYWVAEENYSSEQIFNSVKNKTIDFHGCCYSNSLQRVDRSTWNKDTKQYEYDPEKLKTKRDIVDIHCKRPYIVQEKAMNEIIELSGILEPIETLSE